MRNSTIPKDWRTLDQRVVERGLDPNSAPMAALGALVRDLLWEPRYGKRPEVDLAKKTNGGGTHDKAHYPPYMFPEIDKLIDKLQFEADRQGRLF